MNTTAAAAVTNKKTKTKPTKTSGAKRGPSDTPVPTESDGKAQPPVKKLKESKTTQTMDATAAAPAFSRSPRRSAAAEQSLVALLRDAPNVLRVLIFEYAALELAPVVYKGLCADEVSLEDARERMMYLGSPLLLFWDDKCKCDEFSESKFIKLAERCVKEKRLDLFVWMNDWIRPYLQSPVQRCFYCCIDCGDCCRTSDADGEDALDVRCIECDCHQPGPKVRDFEIPIAGNAYPAICTARGARDLLTCACRFRNREFAHALICNDPTAPLEALPEAFLEAFKHNLTDVMLALLDVFTRRSPGEELFAAHSDALMRAISWISSKIDRETIACFASVLLRSSPRVRLTSERLINKHAVDDNSGPEQERFERLSRLESICPFSAHTWVVLLGDVLDESIQSPAHISWVMERAKAVCLSALDRLTASGVSVTDTSVVVSAEASAAATTDEK